MVSIAANRPFGLPVETLSAPRAAVVFGHANTFAMAESARALTARNNLAVDSLHFTGKAAEPLRKLFPAIEPYATHRLPVSKVHELYVEESGNPNGYPVMVLHGGPGGGSQPFLRQLFDPKFYRIIQFDQRGCGKSTPAVSTEPGNQGLKNNTTWDSVRDIEKIRKALKIDKMLVQGGSWGSTLALAYAETHPEKVTGLILRGIFLCRKEDIDWFYQQGAGFIRPEAWTDYLAPIPEKERGNMVGAYHRLLTHTDPAVRLIAAKAWTTWEKLTSSLKPKENAGDGGQDASFAVPFASIENHYFFNKAFFKSDNQLLENAHKLKDIPVNIVHGRYDLVCPVKQAVDLKAALPHAQLDIIPDAGHATLEPGITDALIRATETFKDAQKNPPTK